MASIYHLKNIAFQALCGCVCPRPLGPDHLAIPERCTLTDLGIFVNVTQDLNR